MNVRALMPRLLLLIALLALAAAPNLGYAQVPATDDPPGSEDIELKGLVESVPAVGRIGEWKIAGRAFMVDVETVFFGFGDSRITVGRCVEAKLTNATPPVALLVKPDDDCGAAGEDNELGWRGKVSAAPASGFVGSWTIGGKNFTATAATFFLGFGDTPPAAGACVEVEYIVDGAANVAIKIHPEDGCGNIGGAPSEDHLYRARVDERPSDSRLGTWVIGGRSFEAVDGTTVFAPSFADASKPAVGDCVAVAYRERNATRTMLGVRPATCERPANDDGEFESHGWLNEKGNTTYRIGPLAGDLTSSISYTIAITTELKEEFGPLSDTPPTCVKVHYSLVSGERVAREVESRPDFRCAPSGDERELYGEIKELPASPYLGKWLIGNLEVQVTRATILRDGPYTVGRIVKVKFTRAGDGTLVALKIEGKGTPGTDDDERERGRGKAYGKIEVLPAGGAVAGDWTVAGQVYAVTADTRLRDAGTDFVLTDCVEIHFRANAEGARTAVKIERTSGDDCTRNTEEIGRTYGFVETMPTGSYTGTWTIGGVVYTAVATTEFEFAATVGAPVVGSFVEVKYVVINGEKIAREISTRVPPGMGDDTYIGRYSAGAAPGWLAAASTTVGGVSFQIDDATLVQEGSTALANGDLIKVNGYRNAQGVLIATELTAVTASYMPLVLVSR